MKYLNWFLALVFLAFAYLQLNDPDPWIWVSIYAAVAVVILGRLFGKEHRLITLGVMILIGIYGLFLLPGLFTWLNSGDAGALFGAMEQDKPYIEESRELIGLLIAEGALALQLRRG